MEEKANSFRAPFWSLQPISFTIPTFLNHLATKYNYHRTQYNNNGLRLNCVLIVICVWLGSDAGISRNV